METPHSQSLEFAIRTLKDNYMKYINKIILYGSCARNEQTENSDVDLFLFLKADTPKEIIFQMRESVQPDDWRLPEVELKCSRSNIATTSDCFNENIEKDGIVLWERK